MKSRIFCEDCGKEIFEASVNITSTLWGHFNYTSGIGICQSCYEVSCEQDYYNDHGIQQ